MAKQELAYRIGQGGTIAIAPDELAKFSPAILGLGSIEKHNKAHEALVAFFDLEGFTAFCANPDRYPGAYLKAYLTWLFRAVRDRLQREDQQPAESHLWARLPIYGKFLGDGMMFVWDLENESYSDDGDPATGNIIDALFDVRTKYVTEFLPELGPQFDNVPKRLRCGIARGAIIPVGDCGGDYVGSCINKAARLQKLGKLSFAVSLRGLNPKTCFTDAARAKFVTETVELRGFGDEPVLLDSAEYQNLKAHERRDIAKARTPRRNGSK